MDFGTVKSVAQSLLDALQCSQLMELCSSWNYESQLENLERTVSTIKAVLLDAEAVHDHEFSHQTQSWIEDLKDAVFDADDLFDELVTLVERRQLMLRNTRGGSLSKKVRLFFSRFNPVVLAQTISQRVKQIRERLDAIAINHSQFSFKISCQTTPRGREETYSFVYSHNIIGREDDMEKVIHMLLNSDSDRHVSFLSIVGIGGLGKTTLLQLVYNHPRIEREFPLRMWICVADIDKTNLDMTKILIKFMQSATNKNCDHLDMDHLQKGIQKQIAGKKYLLVLDDVWSENRDLWFRLEEFLIMLGGLNRSWVVVTTRSKMVAKVVGDGCTYELKGLVEEDSWCLFKRIAFGKRYEEANSSDLVEIGKEIVKRCANVPLAIRVVGSLLYGHNKEKWLLFQEVGIGRIKQGGDGIEPILKLSYHNLEPSLKICFSYCALFPKGFVIKKEMLISLWMAQGYIVPFEEGQSIEDAGEEYFSILLWRCFFDDVEKDEFGEIVSCKVHDLMHDIAQEVAGKEICVVDNINNLDNRVRHVFHADATKLTPNSSTRSTIRTYLRVAEGPALYLTFLSDWKCLRASDLSYLKRKIALDPVGGLHHLRYLDLSGNFWLRELPKSIVKLQNLQTLKLKGNYNLKKLPEDLHKLVKLRLLDLNGLNIKSLPSRIGDLLHLAHLDLSGNIMLKELPESITELHELRSLRLHCCDMLMELPKHLSKLVKLRVLDISGCWYLNAIPSGMGELSCLQTLPLFIVGDKYLPSKQSLVDQLEDLKALRDLNGRLEIQFVLSQFATYFNENSEQGGYLRNKQHLSHVVIDFGRSKTTGNYEEALLEGLQPHPNLKGLELSGYCGKRMPSWARECNLGNHLPNLVKIHLVSCDGLQWLESMGKLCHLRLLIIEHFSDLEYIENTSFSFGDDTGALTLEPELFFPALEELRLEDLPQLKGWWKDCEIPDRSTRQECNVLPSFPRLSDLRIWKCPNLTCIPLCPTIERLNLGKNNRRLRIMESECSNSTLRSVYTEDIGGLSSALLVGNYLCLEQMEIRDDEEVECLSEASELFERCSSSLRSLIIDRCASLRFVCEGVQYLIALETLHIIHLLSLGEISWWSLSQSLRSLSFEDLPELVTLPEGMQHLTALQFLFIRSCQALQSLPQSIQKLVSLKQLEITDCSVLLKERCRKPTGMYWPNIQHIPEIVIIAHDDTDSDEDNDSEYSTESDSGFHF